jgi:hypothetical protein
MKVSADTAESSPELEPIADDIALRDMRGEPGGANYQSMIVGVVWATSGKVTLQQHRCFSQ